MGTLTDAKIVYGSGATAGGFSNEDSIIEVVYDFAADAGEIEDNIVLTAGADMLILDYHCVVETTVVGVGVNIDLGVGAGGTEIHSDLDGPTWVETTGANVFVADAAMLPLYVPAAGTIQMGVETAAITAGKFKMVFRVRKV